MKLRVPDKVLCTTDPQEQAMYCMKCGQELPDDAAFCFKCGVAVSGTPMRASVEPQYELCEIYSHTSFWGNENYYPHVSGPDGVRDIQTEAMEAAGVTTLRDMNELVNQLLLEGWERIPTTIGFPKFRRRVEPRLPPASLQTWPEAGAWQTCEVRVGPVKRGLFGSDMYFVAQLDENPGRILFQSHAFRYYGEIKKGVQPIADEEPRSQQALRVLVKKLIDAGWEEIDPGREWFSCRFRRPDRSRAARRTGR